MERKCDIGMIGLGVMGRNFVLNMADKGYMVVGYDKDKSKAQSLQTEANSTRVLTETNIQRFVNALRTPRAIMMLVPAGPAVDAVIHDLLPHLENGDIVIDGGNSHFSDTNLRLKEMHKRGLSYLGVGISGGEHGARNGPSIMPGGDQSAYERIKPIFEAAAAHVNGDACVTYLGPGSAGHYVKMVHNGIEYALMQMIAESYDLLKRGLNFSDEELQAIYERWNEGELAGYLIKITSDIFGRNDNKTGKHLIDEILDVAKQKGTGKWTSQDSMNLQVPVLTIDAAVAMRNMSIYKDERKEAEHAFDLPPIKPFQGDQKHFEAQLHNALYCGMVIAYAQGMALLEKASGEYDYDLSLAEVARIWRGGCIIRAAVLEDFREAFCANPDLPNLLMDAGIAKKISTYHNDLRDVVSMAVQSGIPVPGLMSALAYFDSFNSPWLPANLIQAQRDYFGAHTYERIDAKGVFHTQWSID